MPLQALLLVLGASLCHSLWNLLLKNEPRRVEASLTALAVGVLACSPVLLVYPVTELSATAWLLVLASGVLETGYVLALTAAYEVGDLSLVYPVARGSAPVLVTPLAIIVLGERPSLQGSLGIALVVVGICASHAGSLHAWSASASSRRALGWALLTGLLIAGYSLVNKIGIGLVPVPLYALLVFSVDTMLLFLVLRWRGHLTSTPGPPARRRIAAAVGLLMMGGYLAVLGALSMAPVSYVVAAREISIVVAAVLGAFALGERGRLPRIAGAVVIFAGLVVIALSR